MITERQITDNSSPVVEYEKPSGTNGLEATIKIGNDQYTIVWTHSHGRAVFNPNIDTAVAFFTGKEKPPDVSPTLLLPLMANGRCAADCNGCVFSNQRTANQFREFAPPARPISTEVFDKLISSSILLGHNGKIIETLEGFRINALMSGDPAFNPKTYDVIRHVASHGRVFASRWSTIAARTRNNALGTFVHSAETVRHNAPWHKLRFQVSLHSTDEGKRKAHVGHFRGGTFGDLFNHEEIAMAFKQIKEVTGAASTLAFVVNADSEINPEVIDKSFNPDTTVVSLRPMIPTNGEQVIPMPDDQFANIYIDLRRRGYDVVVMPTVDGSEMDNQIAGILHRDS